MRKGKCAAAGAVAAMAVLGASAPAMAAKVVAVDGGGSKTDAAVVDLAGGEARTRTGAFAPFGTVLPAGTLTEIWERAGIDTSAMSDLMDVGELVDAALIGFDQREPVTLPSVHDIERWSALEMARLQLLSGIQQAHVAERYQTAP